MSSRKWCGWTEVEYVYPACRGFLARSHQHVSIISAEPSLVVSASCRDSTTCTLP